MKCDISALFCIKNYVKSFKTRENIHFSTFNAFCRNFGKLWQTGVYGVEGMKSHFTYACPNHSGVGVIDTFDLFKYDCIVS